MRITAYIIVLALICGLSSQLGCVMLATPVGKAVVQGVVVEGGKKVVKKVGDHFDDDDDEKAASK